MTEFYTDYTPEQINALIDVKMKIYPEMSWMKMHNIPIYPGNFIYEAVANAIKKNNFKVYRYIGMVDGTEMYHFYNIIV
jgi:uncharacterized membrane protein YoaT (DUF817 family)